jgi:hypothetical protein
MLPLIITAAPYAPACLPGDAADMMLRALMDIT